MFVSNRSSLLIASMLALAVSGCGDNAKDKVEEIKRGAQEKAQELRLNDAWASRCGNVSLDLLGLSSRTESYDFGANLQRSQTFFAEDNCVTPVIRVDENGSYDLGQKLANGAYPLDLQIQTVAITPLAQNGADLLNAAQFCGVNDWAVGQARNVTSSTGDFVLNKCWTKTPRALSDLALVDGDQLLLGLVSEGADKSAPEKRPTQLDRSNPFARN